MPSPEIRLDNLRARPFFIDKYLSPSSGTTLYPRIYVSKVLLDNAKSGSLDPSSIALILHEQEHVQRIKKLGVVEWYKSYLLKPKFRLEEELEAIKPQFAYLKRAGVQINIKHRAKVLSGALYLWPTSYEKALEKLSNIWESA